MTCAIWIVASTLLGLMTCLVIGQFPIEIRQGVTPSEFPNKRTLICRVNSGVPDIYDPIENAIFYLNGSNVQNDLTGSEFEYSGSAGRIIIQLRQDLEGTYTCGDGSTTSPDSVILVYHPSRGHIDLYHTVAVGEIAVLPCGVNQGPLASRYRVRWFLENTFSPINTNSAGSRYSLNRKNQEDFSLIIFHSSLSDSNRYHCEVEVQVVEGSTMTIDSGVDRVFVDLLVYEVAVITYMTDSIIPFISNKAESSVEFACNASGSPNMAVMWRHQNKEIFTSDDKYVIERQPNGRMIHSRLVIKNANIRDSGSVTCLAGINFRADGEGAEADTTYITMNRTRRLVVLDDSLEPNPIITTGLDLLVKVALHDIFEEIIEIFVRIVDLNNQSRIISVQGEFSRTSFLYPFIPKSQLPTEGFRQFRVQVALSINGKTGPYCPNDSILQFRRAVVLDNPPSSLLTGNEEECDVFPLYLVGGFAGFFLSVIVGMFVVICVLIKQRRKLLVNTLQEKLTCFASDMLSRLGEEANVNERRYQNIMKEFKKLNKLHSSLTKQMPSSDNNEERNGAAPMATSMGGVQDDGEDEEEDEEEEEVTRENIRDQIEKLRKKFLDMKTTTIETPENPGCQETQV